MFYLIIRVCLRLTAALNCCSCSLTQRCWPGDWNSRWIRSPVRIFSPSNLHGKSSVHREQIEVGAPLQSRVRISHFPTAPRPAPAFVPPVVGDVQSENLSPPPPPGQHLHLCFLWLGMFRARKVHFWVLIPVRTSNRPTWSAYSSHLTSLLLCSWKYQIMFFSSHNSYLSPPHWVLKHRLYNQHWIFKNFYLTNTFSTLQGNRKQLIFSPFWYYHQQSKRVFNIDKVERHSTVSVLLGICGFGKDRKVFCFFLFVGELFWYKM